MRTPTTLLTLTLLATGLISGCKDDTSNITVAEDRPDAGCIRDQEPNSYDVFFVVDVSRSMGPFLTDLSESLVEFAESFPDRDTEGRPVRVNYYTIGFVNDVVVYGGGRMTSIIAVQAAFEEAITRGQTGNNLTLEVVNTEEEENVLDALAEVIKFAPDSEAKLVLLATDMPFLEAPSVLNQNIQIQTSYNTIYADLGRINARVHAFTSGAIDGITRPFKGQPELTTLPGSTTHRLQDLQDSTDRIRDTLAIIARESSCN